ncbi:MAG: YkgJ family cysteine cluster protein [Candidatus Heimdallarchaeota archaeon]|nr:YkgJ family cysteine cluster protein [Candidatus Heimdallarchaeota archaeon]MCK4954869.1 YkgJ family cysteine cluster protein [Candidatus Heimdallarchaeota archaeon]
MDISSTPIAKISADGSIEVLEHIRFVCTSCAECCKLNNIPITEEDIEKIVERGIEVDQFIEELSPVLIASKSLENGLIKAYFLRKKPFVNECVFVDELNLCKIHEFKPSACQLYPFSIRKEDEGYVAIVHPDCVCDCIELGISEEKSQTVEIVENLLSTLTIN